MKICYFSHLQCKSQTWKPQVPQVSRCTCIGIEVRNPTDKYQKKQRTCNNPDKKPYLTLFSKCTLLCDALKRYQQWFLRSSCVLCKTLQQATSCQTPESIKPQEKYCSTYVLYETHSTVFHFSEGSKQNPLGSSIFYRFPKASVACKTLLSSVGDVSFKDGFI